MTVEVEGTSLTQSAVIPGLDPGTHLSALAITPTRAYTHIYVLLPRHLFLYRLRKATRRLTARYDAVLDPFGINLAQFSLLRNINRNPSISLTELAALAELDRSTIGRNTKVLERMGLVVLAPGADAREQVLSLSDAGAALLAKATPAWHSIQVQVADQLGQRYPELTELLAIV